MSIDRLLEKGPIHRPNGFLVVVADPMCASVYGATWLAEESAVGICLWLQHGQRLGTKVPLCVSVLREYLVDGVNVHASVKMRNDRKL